VLNGESPTQERQLHQSRDAGWMPIGTKARLNGLRNGVGRYLSTGPTRTGLSESSHVNVAQGFLHFAGDPGRFPEAVGYPFLIDVFFSTKDQRPILDDDLTRISHRLTGQAHEGPAITSLRLLAVLNVLREYASLIKWGSSSGARLVLTGLSCTLPRHPMRNAG